ncbi:MAG: DinB family protein [Candidatus Eiseniibacteriota bacterium]
MEPLKTYDYLVVARGRVFAWVRPLSAEQYVRELPTWRRTLGRTLTHTMASEWYYVQRMQQRDVPPYEQWPIREEGPPPFAALEAAWLEQAGRTRAVLSGVRDWTASIEYRVTGDDGRPVIVIASAAAIFTQLVLHEVHHRAQVLNMLRLLGVATEDLDFNLLTYKRRDAPED